MIDWERALKVEQCKVVWEQRKQRCQRLPPPTPTELKNMVAAFVEAGGQVVACPPRFVARTNNAA